VETGTPSPRKPLISSRLSASAASGLGDSFSLGILKNDFATLIQITIVFFSSGMERRRDDHKIMNTVVKESKKQGDMVAIKIFCQFFIS
jgi:hypothetical protein